MAEFKITTNIDDDIVVIKVSGYIDAHTFEQLENEIQEHFGNGMFKLIVDLSSVPYISSAGAGVFIGALSQAQESDGNVVLLNPSHNVKDVLELLGITEIYTICKSLDEAKSSF